MHGPYIEHRVIPKHTLLSWDIVHHIYARGTQEKVVIVTNSHIALLAATRKQWARLLGQVQRERSSTLRTALIMELSRQIAWMQGLTFSAKHESLQNADVAFVSVDMLLKLHTFADCSTMYVTESLSSEQLQLLVSRMAKESVVVVYEQTN